MKTMFIIQKYHKGCNMQNTKPRANGLQYFASTSNAGFSLVELMVVVVLFGLVMSALFTVYQTHQRSAYVQEEVVEVQQNLRISVDDISRDIRMAGFMIPPEDVVGTVGYFENLPVGDFDNNIGLGGSDTITINTGSEAGKYARIDNDTPSVLGDTVFTVDSAEAVDGFDTSDANMRVLIIKPQDKLGRSPLDVALTVSTKNRGGPTITITTATAGISFVKGDMIVRTTAGASHPNTIVYSLVSGGTCPANQTCLARNANSGGNYIVANNITGLQFSYILDNATETDAPVELNKVRAVRVSITAATAETTALSGGQAKQRALSSIIRIRNRQVGG